MTLGEARITYTMEQCPHESERGSGVFDTEAWWLTRSVFAGATLVSQEKIAPFNLKQPKVEPPARSLETICAKCGNATPVASAIPWRGMPWCKKCFGAPEPKVEPPPLELPLCGCGKHRIDPAGDAYAQHRARISEVDEVEGIHSDVGGLHGIGISAPEPEPLAVQDPTGDDVAPDAFTTTGGKTLDDIIDEARFEWVAPPPGAVVGIDFTVKSMKRHLAQMGQGRDLIYGEGQKP